MASLSSWSDLPQELLAMIRNFLLQSPSDVCCFRSVCSSWHSSTPPLRNSFPFPDVFFDKLDQEYRHLNHISIYCIEPLVIEASSASPTSWVVAVEFVRDKLYLVDPFTSLRIDHNHHPQLPKVLNLCDYRITELQKVYGTESVKFVEDKSLTVLHMNLNLIDNFRKAVFVSSTQHYDEIMLVILTLYGNLVFYKLENSQWIVVKELDNIRLTDIEVYQGRVYGVGFDSSTIVFTSSLDTIEITPRLSPNDDVDTYFHFIESSGDLFVVEFNEPVEEGDSSDVYYGKDELLPMKIHKLDVEENRWVDVRHLDDKVFVIAREFPWSISLSSTQSPSEMKNCIISSAYTPDDDYDSDDDLYNFVTFVRMSCSVWEIERDEHDFLFYRYGKLFWPWPDWLRTGGPC
ncbi:hypothetical protein LIER_26998 [Lithospermum erythrorhizon]|uniref:KIB1-4 beta-propeller domain-containing protein n=1 Tax=Lithospermum erythrorhizon TaxID=34254 RepID=A0AAV3RBY8_LITER